jgi:hypothetical protein
MANNNIIKISIHFYLLRKILFKTFYKSISTKNDVKDISRISIKD